MSKKEKPNQVITITTSGNTVWLNMTNARGRRLNGVVASAKCHPSDTFDLYEGARIALARAFDRDPFPEEEDEKEETKTPEKGDGVINHPDLGRGKWVRAELEKCGKPGDSIRINAACLAEGLYQNGDILRIKRVDPEGCFVTFPGRLLDKYISFCEYSIWVPNQENTETPVSISTQPHPAKGKGHWEKPKDQNRGSVGGWALVHNPWVISCRRYKAGDVLPITLLGGPLSGAGRGVTVKCKNGEPAYLASDEYKYWVPKSETTEKKEPENSEPMTPSFHAGDIVRVHGHPFSVRCRECVGRVTIVTPLSNEVECTVRVKGNDGLYYAQLCHESRNTQAPMTLLWREEK